jgi:hypothetical protein
MASSVDESNEAEGIGQAGGGEYDSRSPVLHWRPTIGHKTAASAPPNPHGTNVPRGLRRPRVETCLLSVKKV